MKGSRFARALALVIAVVVAVSGVALAQAGVRVLVVDETKTFASTMRVAGLVGILKGMGPFAVSYRPVDVSSSLGDPLSGESPDGAPYDLIVIVPLGRAFEGVAEPVGLHDDFLLTFLSALYVNEGWLR